MSWLGYPQVLLAWWCPLVAVGLWHALRRLSARLPARERFVLAVGLAVTPLLATAVPYMPHSPLRDALPWRAPMAWGISNGVTDIDGQHVLQALGAQLMLAASVVPLVSIAVSFVAGAVQVARTGRTVALLAPRQCGDVWIVQGEGQAERSLASTVGLVRPRIILGSAVAESSDASAIIEHERAHARAHHPLWIFLATCALRSWWWIPGRKAVLAEVRLTAELWADQNAREADGAAAVAKALCAQIDAKARSARPGLSATGAGGVGAVGTVSAGFLDPGIELAHRARALAAPPRVMPAWQAWSVRIATGALVGAVSILL
ncbi:M48 family metalloprotease [Streptomyces sp. L500]